MSNARQILNQHGHELMHSTIGKQVIVIQNDHKVAGLRGEIIKQGSHDVFLRRQLRNLQKIVHRLPRGREGFVNGGIQRRKETPQIAIGAVQ